MTFLARLIERNLGDVPSAFPILEPRLPSRFEPAVPAAAPWAGEWDVEAPRDSGSRISIALPAAPAPPRPLERDERPDRVFSAQETRVDFCRRRTMPLRPYKTFHHPIVLAINFGVCEI